MYHHIVNSFSDRAAMSPHFEMVEVSFCLVQLVMHLFLLPPAPEMKTHA